MVIDFLADRNSFSSPEDDFFPVRHFLNVTRNLELKFASRIALFWLVVPHLDFQDPRATDNVLLLFFMHVAWTDHVLSLVHQFFAVLCFFSQVYENQTILFNLILRAENVPSLEVWQVPPILSKKIYGLLDVKIYFRALQDAVWLLRFL